MPFLLLHAQQTTPWTVESLVWNPWEFVNEKSIVDGAPALMIESKLACRYGGIISIVYEPISNL